MNYWKKILPNAIIDIDYDKLVADPDKQIPQLIKSSGLDWDKKCMEFYKTNRPIKTASDTQARSKIYKNLSFIIFLILSILIWEPIIFFFPLILLFEIVFIFHFHSL